MVDTGCLSVSVIGSRQNDHSERGGLTTPARPCHDVEEETRLCMARSYGWECRFSAVWSS